MRLSSDQILELRANQHLLVPDFWNSETCNRTMQILGRRCTLQQPWNDFPHDPQDAALWQLFVSADLIDAAERFLQTADLMLGGSFFQARFAGDGLDVEQPAHLDESNNTLLVEPAVGQPAYLVALSYWTNVGEGDGPTAIEVDGVERRLSVERGTVLFYSLNQPHRGTRMTGPFAQRYVSWFTYRARDASWCGQAWFGGSGAHPGTIQFLEEATPRQRCLVGVPAPGHPYWTRETIDRVGARYRGWDMAPYLAALSG